MGCITAKPKQRDRSTRKQIDSPLVKNKQKTDISISNKPAIVKPSAPKKKSQGMSKPLSNSLSEVQQPLSPSQNVAIKGNKRQDIADHDSTGPQKSIPVKEGGHLKLQRSNTGTVDLNKQLNCIKGFEIERICLNASCSNALICCIPECTSCRHKQHLSCQTVQLTQVTDMLKNRISKTKKFTNNISTIMDDLKPFLFQTKKELEEQIYFGDLIRQNRLIAEQLYKKKKITGGFSGKQAKNFLKVLQEGQKKEENELDELLNDFKANIKDIMNELYELKQKLVKTFFTINHRERLKRFYTFFQSGIIGKQKSTAREDIQFVWQTLNNPLDIKLLFRASQNDFKAQKFHRQCNLIPDTLTLVKTEFDKVIGGFTHYEWKPKSQFVSNRGQQSCLFSLDLKQKMVPNSHTFLIGQDRNKGPVFGGGDLVITDDCHKNSSSYSNFPSSYNYQGPNKYLAGQGSYRAFSGAKQGTGFKVKEYQVFKVVYQ